MKAEEIFLAALERKSPAERLAYLDGACGEDAALRAQVDGLLHSHNEAGSFLDSPLFDTPPTIDQPLVEKPGTRIGPYKLLQQVGEGGFGVVFMAEQLEPVRRKVALKVIKPGMDTRQVIARFEAERQALAMMDHPNIARVMDAGATASGRPYFVMELVRGVPITSYCDQNNLPIRERLALFNSVCQAIQHAHTKGIIHRDIKPSNVLVTSQDGAAAVKVIDFGVAKAMGQQLTDKTLFTDFAQMIGTPLYMSPEQAELSGTDIDTRSDIYSLGVMLYELLTGSTPVDKEQMKKAAFDEIRRIIREEEPPKPSTRISSAEAAPSIAAQRHTEPARLARLVRGELDWIVMKALEKDRNRRYETANAFAKDLEHFLNDEPVLACPPSAGYRLRKFARRNKPALATATVIALALVLGTVVSTWQAIRATRAENLAGKRLENEKKATAQATAASQEAREQENRAKKNAAEAEAQRKVAEQNFIKARTTVDEYFVRVSESQLLNAAGMQPLRRELLEAALKFYEELTKQRSNDPALLTELAGAHYRVGRIHSELGSRDEAQKAFAKAQDLYEILIKSTPADVDLQHGRARCQFWRGKSAEAIASWEKLKELAPARTDIRRELAAAYNMVAISTRNADKPAESLQWHRKALDIRETLAAALPDDVEGRYDLGQTLNNIAVLLPARDADALALFRRALDHGAYAFDRAPHNINYGRLVGTAQGNIGNCESRLGSKPQALDFYKRAIATWKKLALDNPAVPDLHAYLVRSYRRLADYQRDLGQTEEWTRTMRLSQQVLERFPQQSANDLYNFACLHAIGAALTAKDALTATPQQIVEAKKESEREAAEAVAALDQAIKAGFSDLVLLRVDKDLDSLRSREDFQQVLARLDDTLKAGEQTSKIAALAKQAQGASPESLKASAALLAIQKSLADEKPERLDRRADVAATQHTIGLIQLSLGQLDEAAKSLAQAEATRQELVTKEPAKLSHQADLAATRLALGDLDWQANRLAQGAARWRQALALLETVVAAEPTNSRYTGQLAAAASAVGNSYGEIGLWQEANGYYAKAFTAQPSGNSYAWVTVGYVSLFTGDRETYRLVCTQALERAKGNIDKRLLSDLTGCLSLSPELLIESKKLVEMAREVLAIEPTAGWRRSRIALAQYRAGQYAEALRSLEGYGDARAVVAMCCQRLGQPQQALQELAKADRLTDRVLQQALQAESLKLPYWSWSGWVMEQTLRREAHALIDGKPLTPDPREHLLQARAYAKLGEQAKSEAEFEAALESAAEDPKVLLAQVSVLEQLGRQELAEAAFQRAAALMPGDPAPWLARARHHVQHENPVQAEAMLVKAASITPNELNKFLEAGWWVSAANANAALPLDPRPASGASSQPAGGEPAAPAAAAADRTWHHVPTADWGRLNIQSVAEVKALPAARAVNYVYSPDLRSVTLLVGSADRVRVELNGELVYDGSGRAWEWGLLKVPALLRSGRNTFVATLFKPDHYHALMLRIADSRFDRGYLLAQLGLWDEALEIWTPALDAQPPDQPWIRYHYAALLLAQGQNAAYRRVCSQLLQQPGLENWERNRVPAACALAPLEEAEAARLVKLIDANGEGEGGTVHWNRIQKALVYYRAQRFQEVLKFLDAESTPSWIKGDAHVLRALCQHGLGNAGAARSELGKADAWGNAHFKPAGTGAPTAPTYSNYNGTLERAGFVILSREAHRLIAGDAPPHDRDLAELALAVRAYLRSSDQLTAPFDRAVLVEPDNARHWLGRYRARTAAGQTEQAERELEQLVAAAPGNPDGWKRRGFIHAELGRVEPAAADLAKALALMPERDGWIGGPRRLLCAQMSAWPKVFERAQELLPEEEAIWCGRAAWHIQHSRWKEAADDFARRGEPTLYDEVCAYAGLRLLAGDEKEYTEVCRSFLSRGDESPWGGLYRAKICTMSARLPAEQAAIIDWAETGLGVENKQGLAPLVLGLAYYRVGEWQRAIPLLKDAAREWNYGGSPAEKQQTELVLAMCEHRLDQTDQARQRLKNACDVIDQAVPFTPDNPFAIIPANWVSLNLLRREAEGLIGKVK